MEIKRKTKKLIKQGLKSVASPRRAAKQVKYIIKRRQTDRLRYLEYQRWFNKNLLTGEQLKTQSKEATKLKYRPLVSILLPLYNTPEKFLRECLDSVIKQTYGNWELCVADDASTTNVIEVVKEYAQKHKNIKWLQLKDNVHIAGASNEALAMAKGEFVALLDHDDLLMPNALFEMVSALNANPEADLLYSDEDKIEEGKGHLEPFFKPDWSPDFLLSCNYITHFAVMRKSVLDKIKGFRLGTEGAQDWDLFLRFTKETQKIIHVPKIIYSWRKSPTSTAKTAGSKPYAYINQLRVLRDVAHDSKLTTSVLPQKFMGFWNVSYHIEGDPKVSVIIPTKNNYQLIKACLESIIEKTSYSNFEIVLVDTGTADEATLKFYKSRFVTGNPIKVVKWRKQPFNFSAACNFGAKHATGDYYLFLNDDTEVISASWIEGLLSHAQRQNVGIVGAKLLFPNDTIQHAGVVLSERDIAFHPFLGGDPLEDIFTNIYISNIRNCAAVTAACAMLSAKKFKEVDGFDESLRVTYNDVDLCLKLLDKGYLNVYTPNVKLYHHESMSVGKITGTVRDQDELKAASDLMRKRWGKYLKRDPFYNDNFEQFGPGYRLPS